MRVDGAGSFYAYAQVGARQQTAVSGTGPDAVLTAASQPGGGAAASSSVSQYDFRKMTPDQMKGVAKDLYQSGKIDLSQLLILETAGVPIGKVGAKGEFVPLSASEKASYSSKPLDYFKAFSDQIAFLEQRGEAGNPKSSYAALKGIIAALQEKQGVGAGVNIRA